MLKVHSQLAGIRVGPTQQMALLHASKLLTRGQSKVKLDKVKWPLCSRAGPFEELPAVDARYD